MVVRRRSGEGPSLWVRQAVHITSGDSNTGDGVSVTPSSTGTVDGSGVVPSSLVVSKPTPTPGVATQSSPAVAPPVSGSHLDTPVSRFIIAAGSIGVFTLICVILYVLWRARRKRVSKPAQGRRGTDASIETQSDFEAYDFDAEKKSRSPDPEFRFFDRPFERRVSIPPAAFIRRSSDAKMEQQKWARQSLQSQRTFYHAHSISSTSQDDFDDSSEPTSTSPSHPKEQTRLKGHRKDSPSPLNLKKSRSQKSSDSGFYSQPISPRTTRTSRFSTTTSVESTPRFQTVDTWVNHQAARLDRKQNREDAISKRDRQRRRDSAGPVPETPSAFRYHPGRVVSWGGASLVPSEVLDAKIAWH